MIQCSVFIDNLREALFPFLTAADALVHTKLSALFLAIPYSFSLEHLIKSLKNETSSSRPSIHIPLWFQFPGAIFHNL